MRTYVLSWRDDSGHPDSIDFEMTDTEARSFIAAHIGARPEEEAL